MVPYREIRDDLAEIDVVDRDVIRSEVRDIQTRVIKRNHAAGRLRADEIAARNFIARSLNDGDGAGIEIESDQFSAIRFKREAHRRFSDIEKRQQFVALQVYACHLPRSRTGNESLAGIRQNVDVPAMNAYVNTGPHSP